MKEEVTAPIVGLVSEIEGYITVCFAAVETLDGTPRNPATDDGAVIGIIPALHEDLVAIVADLSSLAQRLNALQNIIM